MDVSVTQIIACMGLCVVSHPSKITLKSIYARQGNFRVSAQRICSSLKTSSPRKDPGPIVSLKAASAGYQMKTLLVNEGFINTTPRTHPSDPVRARERGARGWRFFTQIKTCEAILMTLDYLRFIHDKPLQI